MLMILEPVALILFAISKQIHTITFALSLYVLSLVGIAVTESGHTRSIGFSTEQFTLIYGPIGECIGAYGYALCFQS